MTTRIPEKKANELAKVFAKAVKKTPKKVRQAENEPVLNADGIKKFFEKHAEIMKQAVANGYKPNLKIENSQVKNDLRTGDVYSIEYNEFRVTITNKTKNKTTILNLNALLSGMSTEDAVNFMKYIQTLPGEVLEDLAIEADRITSSTGQNMNTTTNPDFTAGGIYRGGKDNITTSPRHLVHELGHAMDYHGEKNMSGKNNYSRIMKNKKFLEAFEIGLKRFKDAGNKQFDYNDKSTWSSGKKLKFGNIQFTMTQDSNYCTANPKELWAEIYSALTMGSCSSYNTIVKYFPEAIKVGKEILNEIRNEPEKNRHNSQIRKIKRQLDQGFITFGV